jgi:hypothetical protein
LPKIPGGVSMVIAPFDFDGPGHVSTPEWRAGENPKLERLIAAHPGFFFYTTSGGYRIAWILPEPFIVGNESDGDAWAFRYCTWVAYLKRVFGIEADPSCSNWGRLYRAPRATRDGVPQDPGTIGDSAAVGVWAPEITAEDRAAAKEILEGTKDLEKWREYAEDQLKRHCDRIAGLAANAPRHPVVNKAAYSLGRLCPHFLKEGVAKAKLYEAVEKMGKPRDFTDDIERGFGDGLAEPFNPCNAKRPSIVVENNLEPACDAAVAALASNATDVYQRDGELVRVVRIATDEGEAETLQGTPVIRKLSLASLKEKLSAVADFERYNEKAGGFRPCLPTEDIVSAVAFRGAYRAVRPLTGISETPILRPDGTVLETPGYDGATGFVYAPSDSFPHLPEHPTQMDAKRALADLREIWADFPYRSEADRIVPIALLLTMLGRPAITGNVPGFFGDANIRAAGKTLQFDAAHKVATNRRAAKMTYPGDDTELEKVLASYAMRGTACVAFDNVTRPFGGGPLDKCLTCGDRVALRPLGKTDLPELLWRAIITATGNGFTTIGDTTRRGLFCRLESPLEQPEARADLAHPNLIAWIEGERPRLVVAGLTILRAWFAADQPRMKCQPWGSFEEWSAIIPPAIKFAGGADVLECKLGDGDVDDPSHRALVALLDVIPKLAQRQKAELEKLAGDLDVQRSTEAKRKLKVPFGTAMQILDALYPGGLGSLRDTDGYGEARVAIEAATGTRPGQIPSTEALGKLLRSFRGRVVDKRKLATLPGKRAYTIWIAAAA